MLYFVIFFGSQHVPGVAISHTFSTGVQWIQLNSALSPMETFMETMMNHSSHFTRPSVSRMSVRAKLVLDQVAAVIVAEPETLMRRNMMVPWSCSFDQSNQ